MNRSQLGRARAVPVLTATTKLGKVRTHAMFRKHVTATVFLTALAVLVLCAATAQAAAVYWDGGTTNILSDGDGASNGGAGTWTTTTLNWDAGASPHVAWVNANNDTAVFGGTAGTVTLGEAITVGGLQFDTANYTVSGANTLTFGAAGSIAVNANATISSVIGGAVAIAKTGTGQLTLSGANTFSGQLSIENGTLFTTSINNKSANGVLGSGTAVTLGASGQTGRLAIQVDGGISSNKDFTLATGGTGEIRFGNLGTFDMTNADRPLTLSGTIGGAGNFVKLGFSPVVLSGSNNYSGTTTVSQGPLRLNNANALPGGIGATGGTSALTINGGVVELTTASGSFLRGLGTGVDQFQIPGGTSGFSANGGARQVIVNNDPSFELPWGAATFNPSVLLLNYQVTGNNALTLQNKIDLGGATRTIEVRNNTATLSGDIRTTGGTAGITKTGAGTLVLSGNNTYTGPITISAGTLSVGAAENLGTVGNLIFDGGTLQVTSATALSLAGHPILSTVGKIVTFNITGAGPVVIDSANTYTGPTTISAGTLRLDDGGTFSVGPLLDNGTLLVNRSGTVTQGANIPAFIAGTGSVANAGSGTLVLNAPTYYTGTTTATAGTVQLSHNLAIQNSALNTTGAGFVTLGTGVTTPTFGGLAASGTARDLATVISTNYNLVTALTLNPQSGITFTYGGVIANGASGMALTKTGAGTQVLQGASTYTGATNINAGTLELSGTGSILNSAITFGGGGLKLTNTAAETGSGRVADATAITSNGGTLTYNNTSGANVYAETIGSVGLTSGQLDIVEAVNQAGTGSQTLTLAGLTQSGTSAVTFSAATTAPNATKNMIKVSGQSGAGAGQNLPGGVIIGPWATTGTAANAQTDYAVYDASGYVLPANITASAETTWTSASNAYTLSIPAKTASALTATRNIAALKESSTATVTSATTSGSPTFTVASGHSLNVGDPVVLSSFSGDLNNFAVGTVYYVASVTGTTFTLAATPGGTAINAGAARTVNFTGGLKLDSGMDFGTSGILNSGAAPFGIGRTAAGGNLTLPAAGAGNLYVTPGGSGLGGLISIDAPIVDNGVGNALTLVKSGSGVLRLSGANAYTGGTVLNAGTLCVTSGSNLGEASSSITFNGSAALSFGPNYSWGFANNGTTDLGSHPITVNNGAMAGLYYNGPNITMTVSGAITGSGGIIWGRDPVVTFNGGTGGVQTNLLSTGNTFTGPLTIGVNASENIGTASDFTFNSLADSTSPITLNVGGGMSFSYGAGAVANLTVPNRPIDLRNSNTTIRNQNATYTMTLGAVSTSTSGTKTLNLGNGGAGGFVAGTITDGLGVIAVAKSGTGTWTISGNMSHSGGVSGSGGTLALGGTNTYIGDTSFYATTLIFQGAQSVAPSSKIVMAQSGNSATGLPRFLDDGTGTVSFPNVLAIRNAQNGGNYSHTVFVGNNSTANGGSNADSTTAGSTIALASMIFDEDERGRGGFPTMNITGANGYRLQVGDVTLAWKPGDWAANTKTVFNPTTAPLTITGTVTVKSGATVANPYTLTLDGNNTGNLISGTIKDPADYPANTYARPLSVNKSNSSTWTLSGTNTYTGTTTVSGGTLLIDGNQSAATGNVTVNAGKTLGGTGTIGGATTIADTGHLGFTLSTVPALHDKLDISNTLTLPDFGFSVLDIAAGGTATTGTYTLVTTTGGVFGSAPGTINWPSLDWAGTASISTDGMSLLLDVTTAPGGVPPLTWYGGGANEWSTTDANKMWNLGTADFTDNAKVTFDGTGTATVNVKSNVKPTELKFTNNAGSDVTLTADPSTVGIGDGDAGPLTLSKTGTGKVTISAHNTYTGGTDVQAGTLVIGSADALSAGYALTIGASGTVVLSSGLSAASAASAGGAAAVPEPGTIVLLAAGVAALLAAVWRRKRGQF